MGAYIGALLHAQTQPVPKFSSIHFFKHMCVALLAHVAYKRAPCSFINENGAMSSGSDVFFLQPQICGMNYSKVQSSVPSGGYRTKMANSSPSIANRQQDLTNRRGIPEVLFV